MLKRVKELFEVIKNAEAELKEIRDKCKHQKTHQGNWSDGPGRITHANICSDCGNFVSATGKLPDMPQPFSYNILPEQLLQSSDEDEPISPDSIQWEIWTEGYLCSGMEGIPAPAKFLGTSFAPSFKEACVAFFRGRDPKRYGDFNPDTMQFWGCRLFDNEADARKSFG